VSYFLFIDESGHDHRNAPYEVRGGIALRIEKLWPFVQSIGHPEQAAFGEALHRYKTELKGHRLLDKDRFAWARQDPLLDDPARRKHALGFLNKGLDKKSPLRLEFSAYGQASLLMARGIFHLLRTHDAKGFAVAVPRNVVRPATFEAQEYLRKDHVFLLARCFYFLEAENDTGVIVMDETEKTEDRRFVQRLERYFKLAQTGRYRSARIVPTPLFVSSDMTYPVQAADVVIYCISHGYRLPNVGMNAPTRPEIEAEFRQLLFDLQFKGECCRQGQVFTTYGITYVADPYDTSTS
jgi:hypothetical protein